MNALVFYLVYPLIWILTLLPLWIQYLFSDLLFALNFLFIGYRKKVVYLNLKKSFPEKSNKDIRIIARKFYRHLFDQMIESIALTHMSPKRILKHIRFKNLEVIEDLYKKNKGVILVTGHYGNWEWIISLQMLVSHKTLAIYKQLNNKYFDQMYIKMRSRYGMTPVPMNRILRELISREQKNELTLTCSLSDQRPLFRHIQYWTRFLNQDTPVYLGTEKIARKMNLAVVFLKMRKIRRGIYETEFIPLFENSRETKEHEITDKYLSILEKTIIERPEFWLWTHKRWKHLKPDNV
ncbi:MAG: lysophospholipid acyltransferase family protein [Bacteroidales bacterium]|nr:lysophospholipid acyltransferase family protein [Bacteroidales bacterium]